MIYAGICHCGKVNASFESSKTPAELAPRACQCGFCRRHGAATVSDPAGEVVIGAAPDDFHFYRFGLKTSDFLICRHCGTYVAAAIGEAPRIRATLNVAGLAMADFLAIRPQPVDYSRETTDERIARRVTRWTPTRFLHAGLDAFYFGPH